MKSQESLGWWLHRTEDRQGKKAFFSEEKNQKTFTSPAGCTIRDLAGILQDGNVGLAEGNVGLAEGASLFRPTERTETENWRG